MITCVYHELIMSTHTSMFSCEFQLNYTSLISEYWNEMFLYFFAITECLKRTLYDTLSNCVVKCVVALCSFHTISNKGDTLCMTLIKGKEKNVTFMESYFLCTVMLEPWSLETLTALCYHVLFLFCWWISENVKGTWHNMEETDYLQAHAPYWHFWQNS